MDSSLFRLRSRELARPAQRPRPANQIHVDVEAVVDGRRFAHCRERKTSPIRMSDSDSDQSEHKTSSAEAQRKPLRHLALLAIALVFGAILGALATSDSTASTIVAPPHSRLRFVESKTTEEQPARPAARRPSTRRLRFTKI